MRKFPQEPSVNLRDFMHVFHGHNLPLQRLVNRKNPLVGAVAHAQDYFSVTFFFKCGKVQVFHADFCPARRFQNRFLKILADCHHFAGRLHLCAEFPRRIHEFVKRKFRHLHHHVIKHRLKARLRFLRDEIRNLI